MGMSGSIVSHNILVVILFWCAVLYVAGVVWCAVLQVADACWCAGL